MAVPDLCYRCEYRGSVPGDAHSKCNHPEMQGRTAVLTLMSAKPDEGGNVVEFAFSPFVVVASYYGYSSGWFYFPLNFDPVWLVRCDGFKEVSNGQHRVAE